MVRDGRDVALSWVRAPGGPKTVYTAARRWLWYLREVETLRSCVGDRRFYEIRYEDLLREPEPSLIRLLAFLGERFEPAMLKVRVGAGRHAPDRANRENLEKPLQRGYAERWRARMTPGQLRLFEAVAAEDLRRHGYQLVLPPQKLSTAEHLFDRYVDNPPRKLLAMVCNRPAQREAWEMLRLRARLIRPAR